MKKILALVLALVMTLSLLPMNVWATEPTVFEGSGMYEEYSGVFIFTERDGRKLTCGSNVTRSGEGENFTITVSCQPNTTKTVYLAVGEHDDLTVKSGENSVSCTKVGTWLFDSYTHKVCAVEAEDTESVDSITYTVTRTWNQTKSFTLVFDFSGNGGDDDGSFQYGTTKITKGEKCLGLQVVTPDGGGEVIVARYAGDATNAVLYLKPASGVALSLPDDVEWPATLSGPVDGIYTLTATEWNADVSVFASDNGSNNGWIHFFFEKVSGGAPVTFTGTYACGNGGVFFFDGLNETENKLIGGNAIMGTPEKVTVACAGNERKTIFLAANQYDTLNVSNATLRPMNGTWTVNTQEESDMVCKVYALDVNKPNDGTSTVACTVTRSWDDENGYRYSFPLIFDFTLQPGNGGNQGGGEDTAYWKAYDINYGDDTANPTSRITVRLNPEQAKVIKLPDPDDPLYAPNADNGYTLTVTLHNADESAWRALADRGEYAFYLSYIWDSIEAESVPKPMVKSAGGGLTIEDFLTWLENPEITFREYTSNSPGLLNNAIGFAWYSKESDRTVIIPEANSLTSAWVWGYPTDAENTYNKVKGGITIKVNLKQTGEDALGNAIVLDGTGGLVVPPGIGQNTWMDHINETASNGTNCATRIDYERVVYTKLDKEAYGAENECVDGYLLTKFDNEKMLDVDAIKNATIAIKAPDNNVVAYKITDPGDGSDDPTYDMEKNAWMPDSFQEFLEAANRKTPVIDSDGDKSTLTLPLVSLEEQTIGDIKYYYSLDHETRLILIKWIYDLENENQGAKYEYIQLDTTPYYCQWKTDSVDKNTDITTPVEQPTVVFARDDIKLVTRIHPQNTYGQYFFELNVVDDGQGNTFVIQQGDKFLIILPYSFMGEGWNYAKAQTLKEKPIINHYDKTYKQLQGDKGAIEGTYKPYGIEFEVDSFSPFKLTWTEETTTPSYPGYYNPIVSPEEKPVEKPTETKPVAKPTTPPAQETVTPAPEDTTPVVPDEPPVIDDGAVDDAPAVDEPQGGSAGLWVGVGVVALAAIVVVLAIMAVRKKRKD